MARASREDLVTRAVLTRVRTALQQAGCVRDGRILRRQCSGLWQVVDAATAAGGLTLTLGVYLPEIAAAQDGQIVNDPSFAHLNFSLSDFASSEGPTAGGSHLIFCEDTAGVGRVL